MIDTLILLLTLALIGLLAGGIALQAFTAEVITDAQAREIRANMRRQK